MDKQYQYEDLLAIIETLRGENGCPWDKIQTHDSLKNNIVEESYELVEAINNYDLTNMKEELGDILLQVVMHAQIAKENQTFTIEDIIDALCKKLIFRHPHVFKEREEGKSVDQVLKTWDELKKEEKNEKTILEGMERVPKTLPALVRTYKILKKVRIIENFEYKEIEAFERLKMTLNSLEKSVNKREEMCLEEEIGNFLLEVVNLSCFLKINPEFALTKSLEKFINRFRYIENWAFANGKRVEDLAEGELFLLWEESGKL